MHAEIVLALAAIETVFEPLKEELKSSPVFYLTKQLMCLYFKTDHYIYIYIYIYGCYLSKWPIKTRFRRKRRERDHARHASQTASERQAILE